MATPDVKLPKKLADGLKSLVGARIPTLPRAASEALRVAGDPEASFATLATVIESDAALAADVLRVANSAFYRSVCGPVATIQRAILILGTNEVRQICLGVSVIRAFPVQSGRPTLDRRAFWKHSSACAVAARRLAKRLSLPESGEEFSAGLLHDLGRLVFDLAFHAEYVEVLRECRQTGEPLRVVEHDILGADHAEVGAWLCSQWCLPDVLVDSVRFHHAPENAVISPKTAALVSLGDAIACASGAGASSDDVEPLPVQSAAWAVLQSVGTEKIGRLLNDVQQDLDEQGGLFALT